MRIILFSKNKHKAKEIRNILDMQVDIFSDFIPSFDVIESANTFKGNAILKVKALQERLPKEILQDSILIGEDSGICIESLDNKPGIYSSRYANISDFTNKESINNAKDASDIANINKVIKELNNKNIESSKAYFISCVAAIKNEQIFTAHGLMHGKVINKILGNGGFGYDPIFVPDGFEKSLGELSNDIKDSISHRFKALNLIKILIK